MESNNRVKQRAECDFMKSMTMVAEFIIVALWHRLLPL